MGEEVGAMSHREVHLDMRTNESAELTMRVKALEADVAALQRKVADAATVVELLKDDVRTVVGMLQDDVRALRAQVKGIGP
jgi:hypothetical protein